MKISAKQFIPVLLHAAIMLLMLSCTPEACYDETESYLEASFYTGLKSTPPDSLTVYGLGMDTSKVYANSPAIKTARLPLNPRAESSAFICRINGITDTLIFIHHSYPHLISKECGYTFFYGIDSIAATNNAIDSIWIRKPEITNQDEENIRIFY